MQTTKTSMEPNKDAYLPINHLPLELLSYIFVLCGESADGEVDKVTSIQVVAPSVCHHWRKVALGTPTLWTKIQIVKPVPCERTALFLKRAGPTVPLDIAILITTPHNRQKGNKIEKLQTYSKRARKTLEFILEHGGYPSRWRSLELGTNVFISYSILIDFLSKASLSSLERLEFMFFGPSPDHPDDGESYFDVYFDKTAPKSMFTTLPPHLRSVLLEGVMGRHLFGDISRPQLVGLTSIEIIFDAWHPSTNHIYSMLAASPRLTTLRLNSGNIDSEEDRDTMITKTSPSSTITLSYLRSLSLMHIKNPVWSLSVIQIFKAPALQHLDLSFWANPDASQLLVDYISHEITQSTPYFPITLSEVSFFTVMEEKPDLEPLLSAYPNITSLRTGSPIPLLKRPWLIPNLANLEIMAQDASELKNLVLGRCADGLPLKTVKVRGLEDDITLSEDDMEQIGSKVKLIVSIVKLIEDEEDNDSQDQIES
ncbi:unnamed protein product [Rhizoctonia solani]|uniref:F-box domain-containing protein n=1 Tax=Rhizoctonia solani TaxID=456999 RepID=A0A8H3AIL2_9AGAM|nr:unnamed protein product [Rhizoctonia solani]